MNKLLQRQIKQYLGTVDSVPERGSTLPLNRQQRVHSPQLAAGLASEYKNWRIPYRARSTAVRQNIPCSLLQGTLQLPYKSSRVSNV